jgi:hypothetical protein
MTTNKPLLTPQQLYDYQKECVLHQLHNDNSMLWLQMGLGKTICTLTTIVDRMRAGQVKKTLIFGPLRVIQAVWAREARKWSHTNHLRFSVIHGVKEKRTRAMFADADVYLCNYENMNWLVETLEHYYMSQGKDLPFQMVVYDEVSKLKNSTSMRMAGGNRDRKDKRGETYKIKRLGWRKVIPLFKYRLGLTGTPASNGYLDLFGQYLAVDDGERLGKFITHYKDSYFKSDYNGWNYAPTEEGKKWIEHNISDITKKMDAADYLDLPACKIVDVMVDMPYEARKAYDEVEQDMFAKLESGTEIEVFSKASVSNKCLQFCIAEGTEILTDSGWKPIEQFQSGDKIWDGVEWSNVYSLAFQGVKEVVELDGVWMTPDHKVLTVSGWKQAEDIINGDACERFNRVDVRLPESHRKVRINRTREKTKKRNVAGRMHLWKKISSYWSEFKKSKQTRDKVMWVSKGRNYTQCNSVTWYDQNKAIHFMDKHEIAMSKPKRQRLPKLRRSGDNCVRQMVRLFRNVLGGYGVNLQRTSYDRESGQRERIQQRKLQVGYENATGEQQAHQHLYKYTYRPNNRDTSCQKVQIEGCDDIRSNEEGVVRKGFNNTRWFSKVYDLINSGSRNRFTVRGDTGEIFIVHNCNGSPYLHSDTKEFEALHDAKLNALEEVLEEAAGKPVLCSYTYKSDAARIMSKFKKYKPVNLTETSSSKTEFIIDKWNNGRIKLLIGHPASMGHGVDGLQDSGSILVWFGLNWSLELYEQMNGRINRQGQKNPVSIIRILCNDTVDLAVADAIERKTDDQEGLKAALHRYKDRGEPAVPVKKFKFNFS